MQKHKEILRFLGGGCVRARVPPVSGEYAPRIPLLAAEMLRIVAPQTLLLSLLPRRATRFSGQPAKRTPTVHSTPGSGIVFHDL